MGALNEEVVYDFYFPAKDWTLLEISEYLKQYQEIRCGVKIEVVSHKVQYKIKNIIPYKVEGPQDD